MTRIAFLRGINVGRAKRVAMADLRALMEELGYQDVRTVLNSGNVLFTDAGRGGGAAARIETALRERLGVASRVTVLDAGELRKAIEQCPLPGADDPSRLFVGFLARPFDAKRIEPLLARRWDPERLVAGSRTVYLWCPDGIARSELGEAVGRALDEAVTIRNWNTVSRLARDASAPVRTRG